jgi:hypothetical protein
MERYAFRLTTLNNLKLFILKATINYPFQVPPYT